MGRSYGNSRNKLLLDGLSFTPNCGLWVEAWDILCCKKSAEVNPHARFLSQE